MSNRRPWTAAEHALLGTDFDRLIAQRLQRSVPAVSMRRRALRIASFSQPHRVGASNWGPTEIAMFLCSPDAEVARISGRSLKEVQAKRAELKPRDR